MLILLVCALIFGGPLVVALSSLLLVVPAGLVPADATTSVVEVACSLATVAVVAAAGTSALYRWCFSRPPVRAASLLTTLLLGVFFLSHDSTLSFLAHVAHGTAHFKAGAQLWLDFLLESGLVCAVIVIVCTMLILLVELPLRWGQGRESVLPDGAFRMLRWVGIMLIIVASSSLIREEGTLRLAYALRRSFN